MFWGLLSGQLCFSQGCKAGHDLQFLQEKSISVLPHAGPWVLMSLLQPQKSQKKQKKTEQESSIFKGFIFLSFFSSFHHKLDLSTFIPDSVAGGRPTFHACAHLSGKGISGRALVEVTPPLSQYVFSSHLRYSHQRLPSLPDVLCFAVPLVQLHGH